MSGSIDQIENGRFRLRMYVTGAQRTIGFYDTREEAELAAQAHALVIEQTSADYAGLTVAKLGHKVLTRRDVMGTVRDPKSDWARFNQYIKRDLLGAMALKAVQTHHGAKWIKRLEDAKLSPSSRRNCLSLARVIFNYAAEEGLVRVNPFLGLRIRGKDKDAWTYLTREELPKLLDALEAGFPRHVGAVAIGTGVRPGELVSLRRADVFLDDRPRIIVRYGGPPDVPTKTGAVRTVSLFGLSLVALRSWLGQPAPKKNPHGLVFPRERGGFLDEDHVLRWEAWKSVLGRAGITRRFRWYDLRHTCASWLVSGWWGRRWSLQEVKEMLGHTSITVTQRYAHLAPSASEDAARLTGLQVTTSQLHGPVAARALPESTSKNEVVQLAPPAEVESATNGLGIHSYSTFGAEITHGDYDLTHPSETGVRLSFIALLSARLVRQAIASLTQQPERRPPSWVDQASANLLGLLAGVKS